MEVIPYYNLGYKNSVEINKIYIHSFLRKAKFTKLLEEIRKKNKSYVVDIFTRVDFVIIFMLHRIVALLD